jgi:hypothetical protein
MDHCQGCGVGSGAPIIKWFNKKIDGQWARRSRSLGDAELTLIDVAGWQRALCQVCAKHAHQINGSLQMFGVVRPDKPKSQRSPPILANSGFER